MTFPGMFVMQHSEDSLLTLVSHIAYPSSLLSFMVLVGLDIIFTVFCVKRMHYSLTFYHPCGPGSVVSIATGYGLDGPGIESQWGEIFRTCPGQPWGPPSLLYIGYRVFPGVKSGLGVMLTPHPFLVPWSRKSGAVPVRQ